MRQDLPYHVMDHPVDQARVMNVTAPELMELSYVVPTEALVGSRTRQMGNENGTRRYTTHTEES